jgi:hypothetical protein
MNLPFGPSRNSGTGNGEAGKSYPRNHLDLLSQPSRRKTAGLLVCAGVAGSPANQLVESLTPYRRGPGAPGPGLPRATTPLLWQPALISRVVAGISRRSQWKKVTRGSEAETSRSSLFTSSARPGTSGLWQIKTKYLVPSGTPLHVRCGFRFELSEMRALLAEISVRFGSNRKSTDK